MASGQPYTVKMSQEEILFLSTKLRIPLMFGVDLKMLDLPKEDLQAIMESAERVLVAKDFVRPSTDGSLRLAPVLTAIVVTCAKPERTVMVTRTQPSHIPNSLMFHISMETIVNHSVSEAGTHTFVLIPEIKSVLESLLALSQAASFANPKCPTASLPESVYIQANQFAQTNNPGSLYSLLAEHLPEQTAVGFHQTLDRYSASVNVVRMRHAENPEDTTSDGFTLLQGGEIQWLLRTSGANPERTISLEGVGLKEVRREIRQMLKGK
ncbi:MAG: hypothetical protein IH586_01090 [Anaerolineaceae bacterium]|nr:hypothetical protein [Anaerolineaceae bacterium]